MIGDHPPPPQEVKLGYDHEKHSQDWLGRPSGQQGHLEGASAFAVMKEKDGGATAVLLDADGKMGRAYAAKTTPHMFVIDAGGTVVYAGGIDDRPSTDQGDIATAHNYVAAALAEVTSGKKVTTSSSQPYGCGVKYGS